MPVECGLFGPIGKDVVQIAVALGTIGSAMAAGSAAWVAAKTAKQAITPRAEVSVSVVHAFWYQGVRFWLEQAQEQIETEPVLLFRVVNRNTPPVWCGFIHIMAPSPEDSFSIPFQETTPPYFDTKIEFGARFQFDLPLQNILKQEMFLPSYQKASDPSRYKFRFDFGDRLTPEQPFPPALHTFLKQEIESRSVNR